MKINKKFKAVIIGAGNIGALYDGPKSREILTHAHAYSEHSGFELVGFVDSNKEKAEAAAKIWGGKAYSSIKELFENHNVDVVSVCVPDESHFQVLKELKKFNFLGGIIEKPLASSIEQVKEILKMKIYKERLFLVNYSRRFVPGFIDLKNKIQQGNFGKFLCGSGYYGKGILHNGSHLLDLLFYFGLKFDKVEINNKIIDFKKTDPSYSLTIKNKKTKYFFNLNALSTNNYDIFEIDLFFENRRVKIINGGFKIEEYKIKQDQIYKLDKGLYLKKSYKTQLDKWMYFSVDNLYQSLRNNGQLKSSLEDAFKILKFCKSIK